MLRLLLTMALTPLKTSDTSAPLPPTDTASLAAASMPIPRLDASGTAGASATPGTLSANKKPDYRALTQLDNNDDFKTYLRSLLTHQGVDYWEGKATTMLARMKRYKLVCAAQEALVDWKRPNETTYDIPFAWSGMSTCFPSLH